MALESSAAPRGFMRGIKRFRHNRHFPRRVRSPISISTISAILREIYEIHLDGKENATYHMLCLYEAKLSPRLIKEKAQLREKGQKQASAYMKGLVYAKNPFLSLLPKSEFAGKYTPVPLVFKK